jgi:two-component system, NarL family, invasion response regulator UvrY
MPLVWWRIGIMLGTMEGVMDPAPRILLVDDHAVVRAGVRELVARSLPAATFGEAASVAQLTAALARAPWDLIVLDVSLPDGTGLEAARSVSAAHPALPILLLSVQPASPYAERARRAGARGYVCKDAAGETLVAAIDRLLAGGAWFPDSVPDVAQDSRSIDHRPGLEKLSERELQVLGMLGAGQTVSEIADKLALSVKTVSTYRVRILDKLELGTTAELTRFAIQHRLA